MSSSSCTICGQWYAGVGIGRFDVCPECWSRNCSGTPLEAPTAREALEEFVDSQGPYQLTPRQRQAMAALEAQWIREVQGETP